MWFAHVIDHVTLWYDYWCWMTFREKYRCAREARGRLPPVPTSLKLRWSFLLCHGHIKGSFSQNPLICICTDSCQHVFIMIINISELEHVKEGRPLHVSMFLTLNRRRWRTRSSCETLRSNAWWQRDLRWWLKRTILGTSLWVQITSGLGRGDHLLSSTAGVY